MLMHFDAEIPTSTRTREVTTAPTVVETVTVQTLPSEARGFLSRDDAQWTWSDLRDYVVHEIEKRFGTFPRDAKKEFGIFSRFLKEHGEQSAAIAKHAFEVCDGWWAGAPISINRFCKGSDPYFAAPIKERLVAQPVQGW